MEFTHYLVKNCGFSKVICKVFCFLYIVFDLFSAVCWLDTIGSILCFCHLLILANSSSLNYSRKLIIITETFQICLHNTGKSFIVSPETIQIVYRYWYATGYFTLRGFISLLIQNFSLFYFKMSQKNFWVSFFRQKLNPSNIIKCKISCLRAIRN